MIKLFARLTLAITVLLLASGAAFYVHPLWFFDELIRFHLWRYHARSQYTQVDGHHIHFYEASPPRGVAGTPLVLIHGLGARSEDWSGLIPSLAAHGFHVYAPDLLGFGRSDKPATGYSISEQEQLVVDFMRDRGLTHADIGGWSMGGWIALKLTEDHPQLVDRLAVYDAAGIRFPPSYGAELFSPSDSAGIAKLQAMLSPTPRPLPTFIDRDALRKIALSRPVIESSVSSMLTGRDLTDPRLPAIQQPTLIVWGEQDRLIPLWVGERMHEAIPNSQLLVIAGCGHLAPAECTRPILRGTVEFFRADPPMPRGERTVSGIVPSRQH